MREIKFRAWDKESEKYLLPEKQEFVILPTKPSFGATTLLRNEYYPDKSLDIDCVDWADADLLMGRYELEQFTGLKDKNGKEIYEGDVLWWEHFYGMTGENIETTAKVYWEEKDASFVVGDWFEPLGHLVDEDEIEVIGNIHENSELIEE